MHRLGLYWQPSGSPGGGTGPDWATRCADAASGTDGCAASPAVGAAYACGEDAPAGGATALPRDARGPKYFITTARIAPGLDTAMRASCAGTPLLVNAL